MVGYRIRIFRLLRGKPVDFQKLIKDKRAQAAIVAIILSLAGIAGVQCNPDQQAVLLDAVGAAADSLDTVE